MKHTFILLLLMAFTIPNFAQAQDLYLKEKSVPLTVLLGLDPIPGDALLYAGKPTEAAGNFVVGVGGFALAVYSLGKSLDDVYFCEEPPCNNSGSSNVLPGVGIIAGSLMYISSIIWDLTGGIKAAQAHNQKVQKQKSLSFVPTLLPTQNGVMVGGQFNF